MSRYTDEALSRVLGEHDAGLLMEGGAVNWVRWFGKAGLYPRACANQVAFNENRPVRAANARRSVAEWFDSEYGRGMSPEELLREIESHAEEER